MLIKDYILAGLAALLFASCLLSIWLYNAKESIKSDYDKLNAVLQTVGDDINKKNQELPKELVKVQTIYKDKIQYIERWHYDTNKTNCQNAIDFGRNYQPTGLLY